MWPSPDVSWILALAFVSCPPSERPRERGRAARDALPTGPACARAASGDDELLEVGRPRTVVGAGSTAGAIWAAGEKGRCLVCRLPLGVVQARTELARALDLAHRLGARRIAAQAHTELTATSAKPRREAITAATRRPPATTTRCGSGTLPAANSPPTLEGHTGPVRAVAFATDGRQLASASDDWNVRLWDPAAGQPTTIPKGHTREVNAVAFSPDGRQLASAGRDRTVRLWDSATISH